MPQDIPRLAFFPIPVGADYDGARGAFINLEGRWKKLTDGNP